MNALGFPARMRGASRRSPCAVALLLGLAACGRGAQRERLTLLRAPDAQAVFVTALPLSPSAGAVTAGPVPVPSRWEGTHGTSWTEYLTYEVTRGESHHGNSWLELASDGVARGCVVDDASASNSRSRYAGGRRSNGGAGNESSTSRQRVEVAMSGRWTARGGHARVALAHVGSRCSAVPAPLPGVASGFTLDCVVWTPTPGNIHLQVPALGCTADGTPPFGWAGATVPLGAPPASAPPRRVSEHPGVWLLGAAPGVTVAWTIDRHRLEVTVVGR